MSPQYFLQSFKSIGLSVQEDRQKNDLKYDHYFLSTSDPEKNGKIDFQDGGHLGYSIGTTLASFYLQVTLMLPTEFQVNWPLSSGGEAKNRFSR